MESSPHKQTASQGGYKKNFDKKFRFLKAAQPGDQVSVDRPPRRLQSLESVCMDSFMEHNDYLEETFTKESRKLLRCTTGPFTVLLGANSTVIINKYRVLIPVSLGPVTVMLRVSNSTAFTAGLNNTASHSKLDTQENIDGNASSLSSLNDSEAAEFATY